MSAPAPHTITLPRMAANLLAQVLATPGNITKTDDVYRAGGVIEDHLSTIPTGPKDGDEESFKAWADAPHPAFPLTERQRTTCQEAVRACVAKGGLGASKYSRALLGALGLGDG